MKEDQILRTRIYALHAGEPSLSFHDDESLNLRKVLRLKAGERVACFNGDGKEYVYTIVESSSKNLLLQLIHAHKNSVDPFPETTVFVAMTKGKTKDRIARDLPPLGISRLVYYIADRSVVKVKGEQQRRLQKIVIEACRQCGRSTIPQVEVYGISLQRVFEERIQTWEKTYLFWEGSAGMDSSYPRMGEEVRLIFGPEGGFSPEEVEWAREKNLGFLSMGDCILRSELAAVVGVTLVQANRGVFS